ncbi:MAG: alpha-2-macroglobulin family protein, partial [Bacteroidota bacterium]
MNLEPGTYLLLLKATDPSVEAVEMKRIFTVFSSRSKEIPENKFLWFAPLKTSGEPGEKARFQIGSKEDNVNVLYEITCHDSLISREWIKMNDQAMLVETPITEQLRGDFAVNFVFVKQNRVFQQSQIVNVPYPNRKLNIKFESFRNKIEPGAKETWKISIAAPTGKPAFAEFLAGMYDASLDVFRENQWSFNIYERFSGMTPWDAEHAFSASSGISRAPNQGYEGYSFHPNLQLNWFGFNYFYGHGRNTRYARGGQEKMLTMDMGAVQGKVAPGISQNQAPNSPASNENTAVNASTNKTETAEKPKPKSPPVQVRRDFRETAFFYPSLITDSTGNLVLQFTAPESLTRWKMLGLAHTQNLEYDLIEKELITQKELMVFPNAPRFVRQGDTVIFSAKVANLSSNDLSGNISLDLSDAITLQSFNKLIDTTENPGSGSRIHPMKILKSQSVSTSWKIIIPVSTDLSVLRYRVTAVSGAFSDGEEKAIPVLTNRMLVTESLPLPVRGKGTTSFLFRKLTESGKQGDKDSTLKNHKLTLEFASNPAWYAIQALPTLNDQQYETADAIFSAYWSNSVAYFIANSNPRIMSVFEAWKTLSPDALKSNLSKNEQLKSALLQETPWVMEANTESERKQKLGIYFDANRIEENLQTNFSKLIKLQTPNGGWAWMPGMRENRYTTQAIVTGFGKLHHLGIKKITDDPLTRKMALKAISYLDKQLVKDYIDLKKYDPNWKKNNHVGATQIQYFYARSFFMNDAGFQIPDPGKDFNEAFEYFKTQSQKYWLQQDRYIQGMIAIALHRLGNTEIPALILKSQSEKALHSDEMGMYWASDQGYYWYQAPLETQTLMIEAYDEVSRDEQSVEEMKIWLLKQKQTQSWRSSRATLEACYSLLLRGTDLLDPGKEGGNVTITLGNEKIDSDKLTDVKKEAGTGYFQVSWMGNEIKPDMGKITVSKSGQGVAWGAVYWQYFENIDKITSASTPLHLEKKLFVEVNTPSGPQLEVITKDEGRGTRDEGRGTRD